MRHTRMQFRHRTRREVAALEGKATMARRRLLLGIITGTLLILSVMLLTDWIRSQVFPDRLSKSRLAYDRHDWPATASFARATLREQPANTEALRFLARAYGRMGRDDAAQELFKRVGDQAMQAEDFLLLGAGLVRQDRIEPAVAVMEKAKTLGSSHGETLYELAHLYAQIKRLGDAVEVASQLTRVPGWECRGNVILGMLYQERADPARARVSLDRALRADPLVHGAPASAIEVRKLLARTLLETGDPKGAVTHLEIAMAAGPDPETSWLLSRAYLLTGKTSKATEFLTAAEAYYTDGSLRIEPAAYVGAKACEQCHPTIYHAQQNGRHAQTFLLPKDLADLPLPEQSITDSAVPGLTHAFRRENGTIRLVTKNGNQVRSALVEYALGSDHHGQTMIGRDQKGNARSFRVSVFNHNILWDLTPNVARPDAADADGVIGQYLSADALEKCLDCHMTSMRAARDHRVPEAADHGIGCERCHGPGGNHVAAVAANFADLAIARPKLASSAQITRLCATCHNPDNPLVPEDDPLTIRFQTLTMPRSRCYTESAGGLSCVTCHDPHRNAKTSSAHYEAKCLSCHTAVPDKKSRTSHQALAAGDAPRVTCPVNAADNCLKCHMPATPSAVHHTAFTDHHIRVHHPTDTVN
jgi:tetratricopeptide (TPR) repeat protein